MALNKARTASNPKPTGVTVTSKIKKQRELKDKVITRKELEKIYAKKRFQRGSLKRYIITEHATKFSNELKIKNGKKYLDKIKGIKKVIRTLKYKLPEYGTYAVGYEDNKLKTAKVINYNKIGTEDIQILIIKESTTLKDGKDFFEVRKEYKPYGNGRKTKYEVRTFGVNIITNAEVDYKKLNEIAGYEFYEETKVLKTPYIPWTVIKNDDGGNSEIINMSEVFDLERQMLKEIERDLNLSRKKIIFKKKVSKKEPIELEMEFNEKGMVIFEDGDSLYFDPVTLWNPTLAVEAITKAIDWLASYVLKMTFASRDSMASGAQKGDKEIINMDQTANSYLEDKIEVWSEDLTEFFQKVINKKIEVEVQMSETIRQQLTFLREQNQLKNNFSHKIADDAKQNKEVDKEENK